MRPTLKSRPLEGRRKSVFLLRHGEVQTTSDEKWFIGQTDLPLSERGRRQAQYWRRWLSGVPLSGIIASDLGRCIETARILTADRPLEVTLLAGLREIHLGRWDGMSFRQVFQRWPEQFQRRGMEPARFRPPDGESFLDLRERVIPLFEKAVDQSTGHLLVVAHAGVNRIILCHVLGIAPDNLFRIAQGYGAMNRIDRQTAGYRLHWLNLPPGSCDRCATAL